MTSLCKVPILFITILILSCGSVKSISNNDFHLSKASKNKLDGIYSIKNLDSLHHKMTLLNHFKEIDSKVSIDNVKLTTLNNKTIKVICISGEKSIDSLIINGKYKNGYFKIKNKIKADFIAGPLLWTLNSDRKYIGIKNSESLII